MITYEQDPDVVRWGLHLLDVCSISNSGSPGASTKYEDLPQVEYVEEGFLGKYVEEGYYETKHDNLENDETIAHALQEELSRLAAVEASESPNVGEEHVQASILAQDWLNISKSHSCYVHESSLEDADEMGKSSSCSSPGEKSLNGEDQSYSPEIADESTLDGEVGERLNQMVPVPHVPKINGEIPSVDEATSDHQRLLDRLRLYDLVELKVKGDGNCQFHALSDQIYRTTEHHKFVRQQVVDQLKSHPELYEGYVPMAYDDYLKNISKTGEWGDHVTLQAAADSYGVKIFVITSFKDTCYVEILPHIQKSKRTIFLSFWAEVHYNSIYPEGDPDLPASETKKKKSWWMLGN
uniref:ubiquitinyl hydrolase 1 n=1 Tax=Davidia involucrata TaxID=16924 RepID=A0A5B7AXF3_DAVIN